MGESCFYLGEMTWILIVQWGCWIQTCSLIMGFVFCFPTPTDTYKVSVEQTVLCSVTLRIRPYAGHSRVQRTLIAKIYPLWGSDAYATADNQSFPRGRLELKLWKQCRPQQGTGQRQLDVAVTDSFKVPSVQNSDCWKQCGPVCSTG